MGGRLGQAGRRDVVFCWIVKVVGDIFGACLIEIIAANLAMLYHFIDVV